MARRQRLSETQIAELFDPPTERRELVRYYTLTETDLAAIARCRGDHNRLGHALMRCYLRYPGRALHVGERPPATLVEFIAEQISVFPASIDEYLANERNRQRHAIECQEQLGLRYFGRHATAELTKRFCHKQWRTTGSLIWPRWPWRHAGSVGSSVRRRSHLNGCALNSGIRAAGRCIAG